MLSAALCLQAGFFLGVLPGEGTIIFSGLSLLYALNPPYFLPFKIVQVSCNPSGMQGKGDAGRY